ncbi:hypothetical protein AOC36_09620 [Erysipelothrix larvae]|uniref:Uncharacterized protein n=1 Tax=Erysipelothrix larvae TaxID=1514105 RepID=A0A120JTX2_9FIRM|nr:hypothetical protein [Erysipelothrix larvae]AMC94231.1 hypothetical protein AOC36_09620 [Erysipelothrix larvae]
MKLLKIGDKVRFDDGEQKGIGTIVAIKRETAPYLVHSEDIKDGHDGYLQDNNNNWWFYEDDLELIKEHEE